MTNKDKPNGLSGFFSEDFAKSLDDKREEIEKLTANISYRDINEFLKLLNEEFKKDFSEMPDTAKKELVMVYTAYQNDRQRYNSYLVGSKTSNPTLHALGGSIRLLKMFELTE